MSRLNNAFEQFHDSIQLSTLSEGRINSAWGRLYDYLQKHYGGVPQDVFIQGSYANDTAVKPADSKGEYDLDIVCVYGEPDTAADAIERMTAVLSEDGDLKARLDPNESGRPCVRLRYADDREGFGFHVDIVPARGIDPQDVVDVPMRGEEGWRHSAPFRYTRWCQQQSAMFLRVVRLLKRWRGVHGEGSTATIASIVLQVLIAEHLDIAATSDAEAIASTLAKMQSALAQSPSAPPVILNPVLTTENLAERWEPADYERFRQELDEAVQFARAALMEPDQQASHDLWRRLFGEDFPSSPANVKARPETGPPPPPPDYPDRRQQAPVGERYG